MGEVIVVADFVEANKESIISFLPSNISADKFVDVARIAAMKTPDLGLCTQDTLFTAFSQCAKDGLLPDGKEAAIVIYPTKKDNVWIKEAVYQPMIDGIIKRLRQSGEVDLISAKVVYQQDEFDYYFDMEGEKLMYRPDFTPETRIIDNIKLFFAYAKLANGETLVEVMTKEDVDKIMYMSKSAIDKNTGSVKPYSVWGKFYDRMGLKTVMHRLAKRLPSSSDAVNILEGEIDTDLASENYTMMQEAEKKAEVDLNAKALVQIAECRTVDGLMELNKDFSESVRTACRTKMNERYKELNTIEGEDNGE